jgi:hypothetical protein
MGKQELGTEFWRENLLDDGHFGNRGDESKVK